MRDFAAWVSVALGAVVAVAASVDLSDCNAQTTPLDAAPPLRAEEAGPPSWDAYHDLVTRLEVAEQQLEALGAPPHPPTGPFHRPIRADGNPPVPTAEQRLTALETHLQHESPGPRFPTARLSGILQADAGMFNQDANSMATLGDIENGVGFRRTRLQAVGSVAEFTNYSIEMDFATAGRPSFMDVWGEQTHLPYVGNVRVGHFRQPFSMEAMTSIRELEFLERSLPFQALVPFRRLGIMAYDHAEDEMTTWAYGLYRTGGFNEAPLGDSRFSTDIGDGGGASFSGRATRLLWYDEPADGRYLVHVGGSFNYSRITDSNQNGPFYQARAIPEFFVGDPAGGGLTAVGTPFFADTGRLAANQFNLYGLEFAAQYGSAHLQAEYMASYVDQLGASNVFYDGAYVQGGYFLTGEHWTYSRSGGVFDSVHPFTEFFSLGRDRGFCGWGAWEVTGRWSYVNLNDIDAVPLTTAAGPPPSPNPGRIHDVTLGLNWYWNSYTKVQWNWIHAYLDNRLAGDSDTDIYAARFHLDF